MKNYIGKKIRGFRFEDGTDGVGWVDCMKEYINKIGEVTYQCNDFVTVKYMFTPSVLVYTDAEWNYPISLIEQHLVDVDTNVETLAEIPQLGQGVLMEISDNGKKWSEAYIIAKLADGRFLDRNKLTWNFARAFTQPPKYTHAELVEKLGHDFEYEK